MIACRGERSKAARGVSGRRSHIAHQLRAPAVHPWDDAVYQQTGAIGGSETLVAPHLAAHVVQEQHGTVGLREVTESDDSGANRAQGLSVGKRDVVAPLGKQHIPEGFRGIGLVTTRDAESAAAESDVRGVVDAIGVRHGAGIVKRKGATIEVDACGARETAFVQKGQRAAIDERTTCVGVVAVEGLRARAGLVVEDGTGT